MMEAKISQSSQRVITGIFMTCYKLGLKDAEDIGDAELYDSFEKEVSTPGIYGRINSHERYDVHGWRIQMLMAMQSCGKRYQHFLMNMRIKKDFWSCVYPVSMEFYLMGVQDFNSNPTIHDFHDLDNARLERWTSSGIRRMSQSDIMSYIQCFAFKRSVLDSDNKNSHSLHRRRYEELAHKLWLSFSERNSSFYGIE